jgi:hypothetical protein
MSLDKEYMLTTVDNPYNPYDDYSKWDMWDQTHGYHSSALLGRVVQMDHDLSDADQSLMIKFAIDEIVLENVSGVHTTIDPNGVKNSIVDQPSLQPDTPLPTRATVASA